MAEYTHRQNPHAPHMYLQDFINKSIRINAFRAKIEDQVNTVWNHYLRDTRDIAALGRDLASVVNQVCP